MPKKNDIAAIVLDASAVVAYLRRERGYSLIRKYLNSQVYTCCMHALNVCESAYFLMRNGVSETDAWAVIGNLEVEISDSMSRVLMRRVSALKARHKSFSIGDCVAVAFAEDIKADILTTDNGFSLVGTSANVLLAR